MLQVDEEKEDKDFYAAAADCPVVPEMGAMGLIRWEDYYKYQFINEKRVDIMNI